MACPSACDCSPSFSMAALIAPISVPSSAFLASLMASSTLDRVSSETTFSLPSAGSRCSLTNFSVW
ncbi:Uncharacterised protein [Mycobacteroides abscessus subsp. abscessus]|nr:Uncharacterised protein [Mycobacteroides abscessus subsp. abscessus]